VSLVKKIVMLGLLLLSTREGRRRSFPMRFYLIGFCSVLFWLLAISGRAEEHFPGAAWEAAGAAAAGWSHQELAEAKAWSQEIGATAVMIIRQGRIVAQWGDIAAKTPLASVPAPWVKASTRTYSQSGFGPGYGYLWWTGFVDDAIAPVVQLPPGSFFAWGAGGQFAFVMPADDLVVVSRAPHLPEGGPSLKKIGRLL
jgi:CubicO group peptidase (beta-lactamase class C family)